jgi:hypothetical protein
MHNVSVTLVNPHGWRVTMSVGVPARCTAHENEARDTAEVRANTEEPHSKHGPWIARSSRFIC